MFLRKLLAILLILLFFPKIGWSNNQQIAGIEENIAKVEQYYLSDPETLLEDEILALSQKIVRNRAFYNNNVLAKVFSLLADTAINRGDLSRAMQFSIDGEALLDIDKSLRLSLLLKITSGYYFRGKFIQAQQVAEQAVGLAKEINSPKFLIQALSYRAMTNALNTQSQQAFLDLQQVEQLLKEHQEFTDHLTVLNVLASAHYYLQDYSTALTIYNKIIRLRYSLSRESNIELTYYNLAKSYLALNQLDDAYHAFWKANALAEGKAAPIKLAYAKMGLGQVLLKQNKLPESYQQLKEAKALFLGKNLPHPYLTTLLNLAKVAHLLSIENDYYQYLLEAEQVAQRGELTSEQAELYLLLSAVYQKQGNYQKALATQVKYTQLYKKFNRSQNNINNPIGFSASISNKQRKISLDLAEETDLKNRFTLKYQQQQDIIIILFISVILLFLLVLFLGFRIRAKRLNQQYDEIEKPSDYIATPSQTKKFYQMHFKMSRKYQYPLTVGYFSIDNWQELTFQFNKKTIAEVARTVATIVNEHSGEFDQVGLINQGEYLFLCPHQSPEEVKVLFEKLTDALKVQFFANLGDYSIKVSYDYQSPTIQDIDPYIFLSRLSESTRAEYSGYKK